MTMLCAFMRAVQCYAIKGEGWAGAARGGLCLVALPKTQADDLTWAEGWNGRMEKLAMALKGCIRALRCPAGKGTEKWVWH
jgi:hypothetical protein